MLIPYNNNQELNNVWYFLSDIIPNLYINYTLPAIILTIFIGYPLLLWMYHVYGIKAWRVVEGFLVFPAPNHYFFNIFDRNREIDFDFVKFLFALFIIGLIAHYVWFLFFLKLILLGLVCGFIYCEYIEGNQGFFINLVLIFSLNFGYYNNFGVGFPIIPADYSISWLSWFNNGKPIVINPYHFSIDINNYIYIILLSFCYWTMFRYILNIFYWVLVKHEPNPRFNKSNQGGLLFKVKLNKKTNDKTSENSYLEENNTKNDLVLDENSTVNHNTIRGTANSGKENEKNEIHENQLHSLKLMGFHQGSIRIMQSEYSVEIIDKALNRLKLADNIAHPKEQFLAEISKLNKA